MNIVPNNLQLVYGPFKLRSYEKGNVATRKDASIRPVCALTLAKQEDDNYIIKAIFKNKMAIDIDNFIINRKKISDSLNETFTIIGELKEVREKTKEIVLDNISSVKINLEMYLYEH
jgi:hypothetical protein